MKKATRVLAALFANTTLLFGQVPERKLETGPNFVANGVIRVEDAISIRGRFTRAVDAGLQQPLLVPLQYQNGMTVLKLRLAPAEGTLLAFSR